MAVPEAGPRLWAGAPAATCDLLRSVGVSSSLVQHRETQKAPRKRHSPLPRAPTDARDKRLQGLRSGNAEDHRRPQRAGNCPCPSSPAPQTAFLLPRPSRVTSAPAPRPGASCLGGSSLVACPRPGHMGLCSGSPVAGERSLWAVHRHHCDSCGVPGAAVEIIGQEGLRVRATENSDLGPVPEPLLPECCSNPCPQGGASRHSVVWSPRCGGQRH